VRQIQQNLNQNYNAMAIPTQTMWSALKKNAGIAKAPWWKAADAAVGPALGKLETAKKKWEAKNSYETAGSYVVALFDVHKAFGKFITKKDLSTAGTFKAQIEGWINEVATTHADMQKRLPALKELKDNEVKAAINQINPK
jgi:hypothetical protein